MHEGHLGDAKKFLLAISTATGTKSSQKPLEKDNKIEKKTRGGGDGGGKEQNKRNSTNRDPRVRSGVHHSTGSPKTPGPPTPEGQDGKRPLSKDCLTRTFNKSPPLLKPSSGTPQAAGQRPLSIASNCDSAMLSYPTPTIRAAASPNNDRQREHRYEHALRK